MIAQEETRNILVIGGGYAGVMAALRVAGKTRRQPVTVTLVNGLDHFVERPRLHEAAAGVQLARRPLTDMLRGSGAQFRQGWVTALEPAARCVQVQTAGGPIRLRYDYLIYALGSQVDRTSIPGVQSHAYTLDPWGDLTTAPLAVRLNRLAGAAGRVAVVGGGPTGIEAAAQIQAQLPDATIMLISRDKIGGFKGPMVQRHIKSALVEQGIVLREHTPVVAVHSGGVELVEEMVPADLTIWAGGFVAPGLAREAGLRVNQRNQVLVDPCLRTLTDERIYAVGDAMAPVEEPGAPARMALFTAVVSGAQAANNVLAALHGRTQRPLSYAWYGQGIALGPCDAVGFATYPNDAAWNFVLRRGLAVRVRNFFVTLLRLVLELERRVPGVFVWNGRQRYRRARGRTATPGELVANR